MSDIESWLLEARSRKYGTDVLIFIPLSTGEWAIANAKREIFTKCLANEMPLQIEEVKPPELPKEPEPINLDDLDIDELVKGLDL